MCQGIAAELRGINLGDKRLNRRAEMVIEALAVNPAGSINAACQGWAETEAAYRFFNNNLVTPDKILQPHREATHRRMDEQSIALIVQDTTELNDTSHPSRDTECLDKVSRFGF